MNTSPRDRVFSKSHRIYLDDQDFSKLNNQYVQFIDYFNTEKLSSLAVARRRGKIIVNISADTDYVLYINGNPAAFGQHPSYPGNRCYDSVDITPYVKADDINKLAVLVYYQGKISSTYIPEEPGLIFEVKYYPPEEKTGILLLASAKETLSRIAAEYSVGDIPEVSSQLGYTFEYDSNVYDGWEKAGYTIPKNNRSRICWQNSAVSETPCKYFPTPIKKQVIENPCETKLLAQGIFDYGKEYRASREKTPASYMQNAAMISKPFSALCKNSLQGRKLPPSVNPFAEQNNTAEPSTQPMGLCLSYDFSADAESTALCGKGIYAVIDLMQEESGYLSFEVEAPAGTVITIGYGDHLEDLRIRTHVGGRNYSCSYICNGKRNVFTHFLHRIAGRYLQIFAECSQITIHSVNILPSRYPFNAEKAGSFEYSDALHTKIHDTCLHTLRLCMHQHYEDCPHREQALYAMDSRSQMLCGYYAFSEYDFPKESLRLLACGLRNDGLLELCAPASVPITIPSFSLYWIQALSEFALYGGDLDFAASMLPVAENIIKAFLQNSFSEKVLNVWRGDRYWNFHEWTLGLDGSLSSKLCENNPDDRDYCFDANLTALFITATERLAQTCAFISTVNNIRESSRAEYMSKANYYMDVCENMRKNFNSFFYNTEKGLYASYLSGNGQFDYSELTNAMAIYCGAASLLPDGHCRIGKALIEKTDMLNKVSLSHTVFKYEALLRVDNSYIDYVMKDIESKWGRMLFSGATSFWETEEGASAFDDAGSLCHGWSAVPLIIYYKYILGLRPIRPGFSEYQCQPRQYKNHTAAGNVSTPSGKFFITASSQQYSCKKTD